MEVRTRIQINIEHMVVKVIQRCDKPIPVTQGRIEELDNDDDDETVTNIGSDTTLVASGLEVPCTALVAANRHTTSIPQKTRDHKRPSRSLASVPAQSKSLPDASSQGSSSTLDATNKIDSWLDSAIPEHSCADNGSAAFKSIAMATTKPCNRPPKTHTAGWAQYMNMSTTGGGSSMPAETSHSPHSKTNLTGKNNEGSNRKRGPRSSRRRQAAKNLVPDDSRSRNERTRVTNTNITHNTKLSATLGWGDFIEASATTSCHPPSLDPQLMSSNQTSAATIDMYKDLFT